MDYDREIESLWERVRELEDEVRELRDLNRQLPDAIGFEVEDSDWEDEDY